MIVSPEFYMNGNVQNSVFFKKKVTAEIMAKA